MTGLKIVAAFLAGMIHRRIIGGAGGVRGALLRPTPLVWAVPFWCFAWGREVPIVHTGTILGHLIGPVHLAGWIVAAIATAAIWLHWVDGHRFDRPWKLLLRYGWAPLVVMVLTGWGPAILVGPVVALSAAVLRPLDAKLPRAGGFLDGWEAYWELVLGGTSAAAFVAAALIGLGK